MRTLSVACAGLLALLAACSGGTSAAPTVPPATAAPAEPAPVPVPVATPSNPTTPALEKMAADTPRTTAGGVGFVVPAGWSIASAGALVVLELPEPDSQIALFDAGEAADAATAIAAAWKAYRPEAKRKLRQEGDVPGRDGWSGMHFVNYETSPNEHRFVQAAAFRKDRTWMVLIADASLATLEKRGAQVGLFLQSIRPAGYDRESFAGRARWRRGRTTTARSPS